MLTKEQKNKIVEQAMELISDINKWTVTTFAKNSFGDAVSPIDNSACKWCASGALIKFGGQGFSDEINDFCIYRYNNVISEINDSVDGRRRIIAIFQQYLESL